jgi:hypothetical protein
MSLDSCPPQRNSKDITIGEVWLAWTENPRDPQARELDKYKSEALAALQLAHRSLDRPGLGNQLSAIGQGLTSLLGFYFGAQGERVRAARDAAVHLAKGKVIYHEPGAGLLSLPGVSGVKVYVLGPRRDAKLLGLTERKSEMYGDSSVPGSPMARALKMGFGMSGRGAAVEEDCDAPFDPEIGMPLTETLALASGSVSKDSSPVVALLHSHYAGPASGASHARYI